MAADHAAVALALWTAETVASLAVEEEREAIALEEDAACRWISGLAMRRLQAAGIVLPPRYPGSMVGKR